MESKDEMKKRGLKSPDYADGLMMAMSILPQAEGYEAQKAHAFYTPRKTSYRPMSYGRRLAVT